MMKRFLVAVMALTLLGKCTVNKPADTVILGGKIYTMSDAQPVVEAVAIKGDKIVFAGLEKEARKLVGDKTQVIDLKGKTMTPGFIEGHGHIMGVGYNELQLDLLN